MGDYIGIDLHKTKSFVTRDGAGAHSGAGESAPYHRSLAAIPDHSAGGRTTPRVPLDSVFIGVPVFLARLSMDKIDS